ncbi:MAG TPA: HlyD family efflux transporter periplasmic adaptor subunit [Candidatus Margulisiibacteriota bacterium]|nr:HlyD family efflux transporter periplasmic adaptor subunit [Candidatus Margulisiibacteriota bacterium]
MRNTIIAFALLTAFGGYGWYALAGQTETDTIVLTGFVEGQERIVRSEVAGRVLDVQVREGDSVDTGRLLVRIDRRDAASRRRQQELAIAALAAEIAKAEQGVALVSAQVPAAIEAARAELAQAEADARLAGTNMERERKLVASKTEPQQALDDISAKLKQAEAMVARQQAALELAHARENEIRVAEATLAARRAQLPIEQEKLHELDLLLEKHEVHADAAGTVQAKLINAGELAQPGKALIALLDEEDKYVRVYIPVPDLRVIHVHTPVEVQLDFLPESKIRGEVEWIESQASFSPRVNVTQDDRVEQVYEARVRLAPGAARTIKAGAEANVRILPETGA